ncbi:hypothetical protein NQZ68_006235 [Dissostichus eleginoides]|nr:hypothetical protein NQZ68_006235 [Dissostichus eleginoides]
MALRRARSRVENPNQAHAYVTAYRRHLPGATTPQRDRPSIDTMPAITEGKKKKAAKKKKWWPSSSSG